MEYKSMGQLIQSLRKEKGLTQKQLADMLNITDKAVSKWERDIAYPDTSTLPKLAEILGVTIDVLFNAKMSPAPVGREMDEEEEIALDADDINVHAEMHKERSRQLIRQGLPGFLIGAIGMLVMFIVHISGSEQAVTGNDIWGMIISIPILMIASGLTLAGLPYGWGLINRFLGQWSFFGNILVLILLFVLKLAFSLWIGMIAYPIVLVYNLVRSQNSKRRVRIWTVIAISAVVLWNIFIGVIGYIETQENKKTTSTDTSSVPVVAIDDFDKQQTFLDKVCQNALNITKVEENENITNYGWTVTENTQLHGVFFLEAKDAESPHYSLLEKLNLSNAVAVVTGYYLKDVDSVSVNQWEMDVMIYPNISFDENDLLTYNKDDVYSHSLRADDIEDLIEWLGDEYTDMNITELSRS